MADLPADFATCLFMDLKSLLRRSGRKFLLRGSAWISNADFLGKAVRLAAGAAVGAARALRKPLEAAAGGLARAEQRWSVWLGQVPAGSELAREPLSEKVGASAAVAVVEDGERVLAPAGDGFREVPQASLDVQGPVVGRVTAQGLECGPAARRVARAGVWIYLAPARGHQG